MKKIYMAIMATVMVMVSFFFGACTEKEDYDNLSTSSVQPTVVTDTIPVHDTTIIYHTDTLRIDSIAPGVMRIITDAHTYTGDWQVIGWNATINATHQIKTLVSENGNVFTEDSVVFTETGTMVWQFQPVYTQSIDGPHNADGNGCPDLQATCTRTWTYNVPAEYAEYFVGNCEQVPYLTQGNGNLVTVKTTNGHENKQATFSVNVNIPGPQITDVTATCVHDNWGDWHVINGGIQIDGTNTVTETTHYDNGTSTVTGTGTYACHSAYMFNSRPTSYDHAIDGTYPVIGNTVADLGISMTHTHNHDNPIILNGHNYSSLAPDCDLEIYQVTVVGNNITLNGRGVVNGQYVYRDYTYNVNVTTPTIDTVNHFDGKAVMWSITATYFGASPSDGMAWYVNVITLDNGVYTWYTAPYSNNPSLWSFTNRGTISSTAYNHLVSVSSYTGTAETGARRALALCANGYVISTVTYDPNGSLPDQVKYYDMTNDLIAYVSAVSGTIGGGDVVEPVQAGVNGAYFTVENTVIK